MPETIHINKDNLKKEYYSLSKEYHPDKQHGYRLGTESSLINKAYSILNDDFLEQNYSLNQVKH